MNYKTHIHQNADGSASAFGFVTTNQAFSRVAMHGESAQSAQQQQRARLVRSGKDCMFDSVNPTQHQLSSSAATLGPRITDAKQIRMQGEVYTGGLGGTLPQSNISNDRGARLCSTGQSPGSRNILCIIDPQNDFHDGGSLAVPGAMQDTARIAAMIDRDGDLIDDIIVTLDTHQQFHIAHALFWQDAFGEHPQPFVVITYEDVRTRRWVPVAPDLHSYALEYVLKLRDTGRMQLCIWPNHCLVGTVGAAVVLVLDAALQRWMRTRRKCVRYIYKGTNALTEHYSALKADVALSWDVHTLLNYDLVDLMMDATRLVICGQALSHCVNFTVRDLLTLVPTYATRRIVICEDGSSPVPGFEKEASMFMSMVRERGCVVSCCDRAFSAIQP